MQAPAQRTPDRNDIEETWDEDNWEREPERIELRPPQPRAQQQMRQPQDPDDWTDNHQETQDRYPEPYSQPPRMPAIKTSSTPKSSNPQRPYPRRDKATPIPGRRPPNPSIPQRITNPKP
jgi:hypothetical protein